MLKDDYIPVKLREIKDAPDVLYASGKTDLLESPLSIAVVGSRKISPYAEEVLDIVIPRLVSAGFVIISGLALGVDACAHQKTLDCDGKTIAVLPTSLNKIYPRNNYRLGQRIAEKGLLLSEYPSGMPAQRHFFSQRNRLVSGLSDAVLVIQAGESSGTLITADFAREQNKKLYVIPGEITTSAFAGNNRLIREGATLVRTAKDILEEFEIQLNDHVTTKKQHPIITHIKDGINEPSQIQSSLKISTEEFNQQITQLEIQGAIRKNSDNRFRIID